jgi:hypothetical protein
MPQRRSIIAVVLSTITLILSIVLVVKAVKPDPTTQGPLRECPEGGRWSRAFGPHGAQKPFLTPTFVPLSGGLIPLSAGITDIVEYHDCQRFIAKANGTEPQRYTSLFAIFARLGLERGYIPPDRQSFDPYTKGTPMATIVAFDHPYTELGIERGFNCLYFFRASPDEDAPDAWVGRVVPVGTHAEFCLVPLNATDSRGTQLTVSVITRQNDGIDTPPPVARWDRDSTSELQYIGIRCGSAWCEVHPKTPGSTFSSSQPLSMLSNRAKGWYDEQLLAVAHSTKGQPDQVSPIVGTIMPADTHGPEFGPPTSENFLQRWRPVAKIAIRGDPGYYSKKLNLIRTDAGTTPMNEVAMCFIPSGAANSCVPVGASTPGCKATEGWFAKISHLGESQQEVARYYCVIRTEHDGPGMQPALPVPNAPRWRWAIDDETIWTPCMSGCCEVKAK